MVMMDYGVVQVNFVPNQITQRLAICFCATNINELLNETEAGDEMLVLEKQMDVCDNCNEPITAGAVKPCECRTCHVRSN
jgi:hypothetical protein